jgi:uncharacterized small protein (DUF1192 family)
LIGAIVSSRIATLHELETVYSLEDAYELIEVLSVDAINRRIAADKED